MHTHDHRARTHTHLHFINQHRRVLVPLISPPREPTRGTCWRPKQQVIVRRYSWLAFSLRTHAHTHTHASKESSPGVTHDAFCCTASPRSATICARTHAGIEARLIKMHALKSKTINLSCTAHHRVATICACTHASKEARTTGLRHSFTCNAQVCVTVYAHKHRGLRNNLTCIATVGGAEVRLRTDVAFIRINASKHTRGLPDR